MVAPNTIVISMAVGIVVTVIAAYVPARKAAKVADRGPARLGDRAFRTIDRSRVLIGTLAAALGGGALMATGLADHKAGTVGQGALLLFIGVLALGPVLARPFTRVIGPAVAPAVRGMAGTLPG